LFNVLEQGLAFFTVDGLVQLLEILGDGFLGFFDPLVLLLDFFGTRIDQQVALRASCQVYSLADIVGPDRFRETFVDQSTDVVVESADAQVGQQRDAEQQGDDDAEAEPETGADSEILEHEDLPPERWVVVQP
jgi:hypothetical protein